MKRTKNTPALTRTLQAQAVGEIRRAFSEAGVSETDVAKKLRKKTPYVSQLLNGHKLINLRNLGLLALAADAHVEIKVISNKEKVDA